MEAVRGLEAEYIYMSSLVVISKVRFAVLVVNCIPEKGGLGVKSSGVSYN